MIRVILIADLSEIWGAEEAFDEGGSAAVEELCREDLLALVEEARWSIERIPDHGTGAEHDGERHGERGERPFCK